MLNTTAQIATFFDTGVPPVAHDALERAAIDYIAAHPDWTATASRRCLGCAVLRASNRRSAASGSNCSAATRTLPPFPYVPLPSTDESDCLHRVRAVRAGRLPVGRRVTPSSARQKPAGLLHTAVTPETEHRLLFLLLRATSHERCLR